MRNSLDKMVQQLELCGWRCVRSVVGKTELPASFMERYPWIPEDIMDVICGFDEVVNQAETVWLLNAKDYAGKSSSAFAWNEFELQSIEACNGVQNWVEEVRRFWDNHLPIALSVRGEYAYWALKENGTIVMGREPEYEDSARHFASSFGEFLIRLGEEEE